MVVFFVMSLIRCSHDHLGCVFLKSKIQKFEISPSKKKRTGHDRLWQACVNTPKRRISLELQDVIHFFWVRISVPSVVSWEFPTGRFLGWRTWRVSERLFLPGLCSTGLWHPHFESQEGSNGELDPEENSGSCDSLIFWLLVNLLILLVLSKFHPNLHAYMGTTWHNHILSIDSKTSSNITL